MRASILTALLLSVCLPAAAAAQPAENRAAPQKTYARWSNSLPDDPEFFPIAVWLQAPRNAERYKEAGINVYVGLWRGPTEEQLRTLKQAGMKVICSQNETGLTSGHADIIVGWMHGDEPDNAQARRGGGGYGPPILPSKIVEDYREIQQKDPTRPVFLNLGQGVAFDNYIGRGVRRNHPEDYPQYIEGCDIVSFDIYPAVHDHEEVAGKLEFVARGVERLHKWSKGQKIVWNCIECSRISNVNVKPTPEQIRSEVWMSLIHGSQGLIYFVHQFEPRFIEASVLEDDELLPALTALNQQIHRLAPVLNSPTIEGVVSVTSSDAEVPIGAMCKRHEGALYVFACSLSNRTTEAQFGLSESEAFRQVEVLDEDRMLTIKSRRFADRFDGYGVHLYRLTQ